MIFQRLQIKVTDKDGNSISGLTIAPTGNTGEFKVTLPPNTLEFEVHIPTEPDSSFEVDETYTISGYVVGGKTTDPETSTGTITDIAPKVSIERTQDGKEADISKGETKQDAEFKISLDKTSSEAITIQLIAQHIDTSNADFDVEIQLTTMQVKVIK